MSGSRSFAAVNPSSYLFHSTTTVDNSEAAASAAPFSRRRENDSFASQRYASSAEIPSFQSVYRRKRENDQWIVKTAMKAVLLSPVLVLVVWSIAAVAFTHKQLQPTNTSSSSSNNMQTMQQQSQQQRRNQKKGWFGGNSRRASQQEQQQQQLFFPAQGAPLIVQPNYLPLQPPQAQQIPAAAAAQQQLYYATLPEQGDILAQNNNALVGVPPLQQGSSSAQQQQQQQYFSFPEQEAENHPIFPLPLPEQGSSASTLHDNYPTELGASPEKRPLVQVVAQQYGAVPLPPVVTQEGDPTTQQQQYFSFPEQGASPENPLALQLPPPQQGADYYYTLPEQGVAAAKKPRIGDVYTGAYIDDAFYSPQQQPAAQAQQPVMPRAAQQPLAAHANYLRHNQQQQQKHQNVKYFYYDPKTTKKDIHGHLHLPQIVYDAFGRAVSLKSLSAAAPVYMEAPPTTMTHQNASTYNGTIYNYTHTHPPVVETRQKRSMSLPRFGADTTTSSSNANGGGGWGTSTAADSSLIVCTVGVMALLVGALSARRMRSRSILSACIENEALLEDEAAYDTAYTVNNVAGGANHYNTFQQGWKGDLEKFDV